MGARPRDPAVQCGTWGGTVTRAENPGGEAGADAGTNETAAPAQPAGLSRFDELMDMAHVLLKEDEAISALLQGEDLPPEDFDREATELLRTAPVDFEAGLLQAKKAEARRDKELTVASLTTVGFVELIYIACSVIYWFLKVTQARHIGRWPIWPAFVAGLLVALYAYYADYLRKNRAARPAKRSQTIVASQAESARASLDDQIRSLVVIPAIYNAVRLTFVTAEADVVSLTGALSLPFHINLGSRIETASYRRAFPCLSRAGGAVIALAGSRGVGKSELLMAFCGSPARKASLADGGVIGIIVPAPVAYDAQSFLRLVVRRLAESVPGYDRGYLGGRIGQVRKTYDIAAAIVTAACLAAGLVLRFGVPAVSRHTAGWAFVGAAAVLSISWLTLRSLLGTGVPGLQIFFYRYVRFPRRRQASAKDVGTKITRKRRHELAGKARAVAQGIRYVETRSVSMQSSASVHGLGLSRTSGLSLDQVPLSEADLAGELSKLVSDLHSGSYEVRVGIDELDKLTDGDQAEKFLNGIKVLFPIHDCAFILTISQDAAAQFARRGTPVRDVFDSSLDTVVMVDALTFREARQLLRARIRASNPAETPGPSQDQDSLSAAEMAGPDEAGHGHRISDSQVLLCHCLSGGLPRDLLRFCRQLGDVNSELGGDQHLARVAEKLVNADVRSRIDALRVELRGKADIDDGSSFVAELERLYQAVGTPGALDLLVTLLAGDSDFTDLCRSPVAARREPAGPAAGRNSTNHKASQQSTSGADTWIRDARRQICSYIYFAEEVRRMFGSEGPLARELMTQHLAAYEKIAEARRQLEFDAAAGWRYTTHATTLAGLVPRQRPPGARSGKPSPARRSAAPGTAVQD